MAKQKGEKHKTDGTQSMSLSLNSDRAMALLIFAFSFLLYFNSVFNGYNLDDELVTQHHRLTSKGISAIPEIFASPYYQDEAGYKYEYRPIVLVTFAIEHSLFGERAWVSHLLNVLLYSLLCLLLFSVLKKLLKDYRIVWPLLITLFFAAHPVHTEVVDSIKNRDEILALIFGLLGLYCAVLFANKRNYLYLAAIPVFFVLGILSKATAVIFALLIPLTLAMLVEIPVGYLVLVSVVLIVPGVFFARLYSVVQQLGMGLGMLLIIGGLYFLRHAGNVWIKLKEQAAQLKIRQQTAMQKEEAPLRFAFFKQPLLALPFLAVVILSVLLSAVGVYKGVVWLAIGPLLLLAIIYLLAQPAVRLVLVTPITIIALIALLHFHLNASLFETALCVFLGSVFLSNNRRMHLAGAINFIFYAALTGFVNHSLYFLTGVVFLSLLNQRTRILFYFIIAAFVAFYGKAIYDVVALHKVWQLSLLGMPLLIAAAVLAFMHKTKWLAYSVLLIPVFMVFSFMVANPAQNFSIGQAVKDSYYNLNDIKAADAVAIKTVRPLIYIETPVTVKDPLSIRLGTALTILGKYFKLIFVPYPLSYYYGFAYISPTPLSNPVALLWLVVYLAVLVLALVYIQRQPLLSFSILFYLAAIAAFSNLAIPIPGMMGDRFLLVPSIGFCVFLVFILFKLTRQGGLPAVGWWNALKPSFKIASLAILLLYSVLTFSRNLDWKNHVTLFTHDISAVENSAQAQNLVALHLFFASNAETDAIKKTELREKSLAHFKRAVEIYPKFLNATFDRGRLLESMGRYDEALQAYTQATKIDSNFKAPYFNMGVIYQSRKNDAEAVPCYEQFLTSYPLNMQAYANLSFGYFRLGQYDKSITTNHRALAVSPGAFDPTVNIAITYKHTGQLDSAVYYYEKARAIKPDYPNIDNIISNLKAGL